MTILDRTAAWLTDPAHWSGTNGIAARLIEHIGISALSLVIGLAIALPVGLYIGHSRRGVALAINVANLWRALPSRAVIAIVLPITAAIDRNAGFLFYPTVVAMVVLALPPIIVNTYSGISGIDADVTEAARGQGMSGRQVLARVELPLAVPVIVTGVRSAAVQVISTATLGAIFGFGGLGRFLVDGFSRGDTGQMVGGALLVGGVVIAADAAFAVLQRAVTPRPLRAQRSVAVDAA